MIDGTRTREGIENESENESDGVRKMMTFYGNHPLHDTYAFWSGLLLPHCPGYPRLRPDGSRRRAAPS